MQNSNKKDEPLLVSSKKLSFNTIGFSNKQEQIFRHDKVVNNSVTDAALNKINVLEGSIRMIEKKYRQNLKQGFDNKIKAFRLQAVMQRKILQQKLMDADKSLRAKEQQKIYQRAQKQREYQQDFIALMNQRKRQRSFRIKQKSLNDKRLRSQSYRDNFQRIQQYNKESHDKILEEHEYGCKKKQYFEQLKKQMLKRHENTLKRQQLQRIMQQKEKLLSLKDELDYWRNTIKQKDKTFLTI